MTKVTMVQFRRQLSELLNTVIYRHKFFVLTRHGKPVAMLIPYAKRWEQEEIESSLWDDDPVRVELPPGPEHFKKISPLAGHNRRQGERDEHR